MNIIVSQSEKEFIATYNSGKRTVCSIGGSLESVLQDLKNTLDEIGIDASKDIESWTKSTTCKTGAQNKESEKT